MSKLYPIKTRIFFFLVTFITLIGLDQWTKLLAVEHLKGQMPKYYFFGTFQLTYAENTGAWGNFGGNWEEPFKSLFLIALPIVVLLGFGIFALISQKITKIEYWAYTLISAGGMGNLIDRIRLKYVIDFMYAGIRKPFETNIFNIADVVIMIGAGMMMLHIFLDWKRGKIEQGETTPTPPSSH